jgi:NAD(P)-dependent dehydrogenase (short-subunit alcohol dehydrogenase family)
MSTPPPSSVITGANSGLGKALARALADAGDRVFMVSRDPARGAAARDELITQTGNRNIDLLIADLASQAEVRRLADLIAARTDRVDRLINNAATAYPTRGLTTDGVERTFAVNHLAPFLLTNLLLPLLQRAAPARIVSVGTRIDTAIALDDVNFERRRYSMMRAYGQAKLGNILFTRALAARLDGTGVTANCVFPGVFRSNLGGTDQAQPLLLKWFARGFGWALPTPERAAERVLYLLRSDAVANTTGGYFGNRRQIRAPAQADDPNAIRRLWELSAELTGLPSAGRAGIRRDG